jgi:hypothetical protein
MIHTSIGPASKHVRTNSLINIKLFTLYQIKIQDFTDCIKFKKRTSHFIIVQQQLTSTEVYFLTANCIFLQQTVFFQMPVFIFPNILCEENRRSKIFRSRSFASRRACDQRNLRFQSRMLYFGTTIPKDEYLIISQIFTYVYI